MQSSLRIAVALLLVCSPIVAQDSGSNAEEVSRLLLDANRALQAGNAARFLSYFDASRFAGYTHLENQVVPLTAQADIASSIEVLQRMKREGGYELTIDWILQLTPASGFGDIVQRREEITVHVGAAGGKPKIEDLKPVGFFRPL